MVKKILFLILIAVIGLSAYLYWKILPKRIIITPYPYSFSEKYTKKFNQTQNDQLKKAKNSQILIVGDQLGKTLDPHIPYFQNLFKESLKNPPSIFNWSEQNEGLHRTLFKLKNLEKIPPIVIYFGGSSELQEKIFNVNDKLKIEYNFKVFDDEMKISSIITFPYLSKFFYKDITYFDLEESKEYKSYESSNFKFYEKELSFFLYKYEIKELIDLVKSHNSQLIFITTPLNLDIEPKEVCVHSSSEAIVELQQEIENDIKEGAFKSALPKAVELAEVTTSNARSYFLLGKSAQGAGDYKLARENLLKATVFDCQNWRGNAVYNSIIRSASKKYQLQMIDFEQLMSSNISSDALFFDELIPQNIFYQTMTQELGDILKNILKLNQ